MSTWRTAIEAHYRKNWRVAPQGCPFFAGPIHQLPREFAVLKLPPREDRKMWTYATCCMSQPDDPKSIELHMFSPYESEDIVELLFATAHYHITAARLDLGHSVNFGRPWLDGSNCQHGLISLPYLDGPLLENLTVGSSVAKFYWLIPISASEVAFKKQNGVEALEQRFEDSGFDYLNPQRESVV